MAARRPNILFVICDDLCWGDLASHGNPVVRTPRLDALRDEATRLTRYCSGPVCTPARACIMTGRSHLRTRAIDTYCGRSSMDADEITVASVLAQAGYATGCFGKWHLGDTFPLRPCDQGFGESLWHLSGGIGQPGDHPDNHARDGGSYFDPVCLRGDQEERTSGYCSDVFTDATLDFIGRHRNQPWFAYLAFNAPHTPLVIGDEWADPYRAAGCEETLARLYGMVTNIDHNVGRLLDALATDGLAEDTLVVFTSDHGPCGSATLADGSHRFNGGLRSNKGSVYQGGIQVPCLLRLPGALAAGCDRDRIAGPVDWLPTFAGLAGAEVPGDRAIDGTDLGPLLRGEVTADTWPDRVMCLQWHRGDAPVRYRNATAIDQNLKWTRPHEDAPDECYDLDADPGEATDLAAERPADVARLRAAYDAWFDSCCAERPDTFDPPAIPVGDPRAPLQRLSQNDRRIIDAEGWGDDKRGEWWISAPDGDTAVSVHLRWGPDVTPERCFVRLDEAIHGCGPGEDLPLIVPAGTHRIEAWCEAADGRWSARYVELRSAVAV